MGAHEEPAVLQAERRRRQWWRAGEAAGAAAVAGRVQEGGVVVQVPRSAAGRQDPGRRRGAVERRPVQAGDPGQVRVRPAQPRLLRQVCRPRGGHQDGQPARGGRRARR